MAGGRDRRTRAGCGRTATRCTSRSTTSMAPSVERPTRAPRSIRQPADEPYGRVATLIDPFGHRWMLNQPPRSATRVAHGDIGYVTLAVPDDERAKAFYGAVLGWQFSPGNVPRGWQVEGRTPMLGVGGGGDDRRGNAVLPRRRHGCCHRARAQRRRRGQRSPAAALWPARLLHRRPGHRVPTLATHRLTTRRGARPSLDLGKIGVNPRSGEDSYQALTRTFPRCARDTNLPQMVGMGRGSTRTADGVCRKRRTRRRTAPLRRARSPARTARRGGSWRSSRRSRSSLRGRWRRTACGGTSR